MKQQLIKDKHIAIIQYDSSVDFNYSVAPAPIEDANTPPGIHLRVWAEIRQSDETVSMDGQQPPEALNPIAITPKSSQRIHLDFRLPTHKYLNYMLLLDSTEEWLTHRASLVRGPTQNRLDDAIVMSITDHCAPWHIEEAHLHIRENGADYATPPSDFSLNFDEMDAECFPNIDTTNQTAIDEMDEYYLLAEFTDLNYRDYHQLEIPDAVLLNPVDIETIAHIETVNLEPEDQEVLHEIAQGFGTFQQYRLRGKLREVVTHRLNASRDLLTSDSEEEELSSLYTLVKSKDVLNRICDVSRARHESSRAETVSNEQKLRQPQQKNKNCPV